MKRMELIMPYSDYVCFWCGHVFEFFKDSFTENFPKNIECPTCGKSSHRKYSNMIFDMAEGKLGNSKNDYNKGITYHPGSLVGKCKGVKIK